MSFKGKVAIVTGGGSGMGQVMAKQLASAGAKVAILDVNEAGMSETAASSDNITAFRCDVTNLQQVQEIVAKVESEIGSIDRLAHAAGIMPGGSIEETPPEKIMLMMNVNYGGTIHLTKTVLPYMLKRNKGELILFGSVAGIAPPTDLGPYCATKSAVNTFAEVLHYENRGNNLKILLVCPAAVNTPLIDQALDAGPKSLRRQLEKGKMASPEFIIEAIEKALVKGKWNILPGEAAVVAFLRRLSPSLLWKLVDASNK